ncbi:VacJ family lipoprotein [uncultured Candidatus Thioglobus sp.]|nr:VacJ family lipoprotein [uncultured Candidatus Thioglobus sp.]
MNKILLILLLFGGTISANDDPFEEVNRVIYDFNQSLDEAIFEPIAKSYKENLPASVQNRVSDFSSNIGDVSTLGNELVQFELVGGAKTLSRVLLNSTVGLLGLFDVASEIGLEKSNEDFGQTMAVWGAPKGAYVVLPLVGPSTLRDTVGRVADSSVRVQQTQSLTTAQKVGITTTEAVNTRVRLLPVTDLLKESDDPYTLARSAYLQKRQFDIHNGELPEEDEF